MSLVTATSSRPNHAASTELLRVQSRIHVEVDRSQFIRNCRNCHGMIKIDPSCRRLDLLRGQPPESVQFGSTFGSRLQFLDMAFRELRDCQPMKVQDS